MFQVEWTETALNQPAAIWTTADDSIRGVITRATDEIDRLLRVSAVDAGESREENLRILFVLPLGVSFHVHQPSRTAAVYHVWFVRKRS